MEGELSFSIKNDLKSNMPKTGKITFNLPGKKLVQSNKASALKKRKRSFQP